MDGNYTIPSLSGWSGQYDPMRIGFQNAFAQASQASVPSQPSQSFHSGSLSDAEIDALMYPVAPGNPLNLTVIGIRVNGTSTRNKAYLPEIYRRAGIPFVCHSCGKDLTYAYTYVGDHQPPTKLREKSVFIKAGTSTAGIYSRIINRIASNRKLLLFQFTSRAGRNSNVHLQTNSFITALLLCNTWPEEIVTYEPSLPNQYLYPHCIDCSNRQGRGMM